MTRMGDKTKVDNMVPEECKGCPHRSGRKADTGHGLIDTAARVEGAAVEVVTGERQDKCGLCGCPLVNLSLTNLVPEGCPRTSEHGGEQ